MIDETMDNQQVVDFELGWLAGIIDGEGYLGITFQNKKRSIYSVKPEIQIVNTDRDIINKTVRILRQIGINPYIRMRRYKTSSWNDAWTITIGKFSAIVKVLKKVNKYMTGIKKSKAELMLQFCTQRIPKGRRKYDKADLALIKEFKSKTSTTIPEGSRTQESSKRKALILGDDIVCP